MRKITTLVAVSALLALLAPGAGARTVAPPGNSEADQYYQTLPGSAGPRAPRAPKTIEDAVREGRVDAEVDSALRRRGAIGVAAADAIARTAPASGQGQGEGDGGSPPTGTTAAPDEQGLGGLFLPILAVTAVAALAFVVARRRRTATQ